MPSSTIRSFSPPPVPSPQLLPTPLPSPPPFRSARPTSSRARFCGASLSMREREKRRFGLGPESFAAAPTSPPLTARSLPSRDKPTAGRMSHRRSLSNAIPYRSPPPSPRITSPPPPVPPVSPFVLSPSDKKPVLHPSRARPELAELHMPGSAPSPALSTPPIRPQKSKSSAGLGMTCSGYLSMHNNKGAAPTRGAFAV